MKLRSASIICFSPTFRARRPAIQFHVVCLSALVAGLWGHLSAAAEFREIDGSGNNLYIDEQGAANTRVIRFGYDADYPDGIGDVIVDVAKPNARDVSNRVNAQSSSIVNDRGLSDWIVQWGQFLTHDISLIPTGAAYNTLSTGVLGDFSIAINDPGDVLGPGPIAFNRSAYDPTSGNGDTIMTPRGEIFIPRWQINANTSYIDASQVYGSDPAIAASLRAPGGKLAASAGGLLPPTGVDGKFLAGDIRANENVSLSATHALFVREHNRLANLIQAHDASLTDDEVYQWARKIVGAEMQAITYREFLPALMGGAAPAAGDYFYDDVMDASITTAFSTAAFRYGHSMQSPEIKLVNDAGIEVGAVNLAAATAPNSILTSDPGKVGLILKGLASQTAQENDVYVIDELRNIPFGPPGSGGIDLAALDIQRGRDHGLINDYNRHRIAYSMPMVTQFGDVTSDPAVQAALTDAYGTVENLDAWIAMIAEDHVVGSNLGRMAQIIVKSQFERLRDGDRFFYSGDPDLQSGLVLSIIDLDSITLGEIIELNTGMTSLQENVFFAVAAVPEPATCVQLAIGVSLVGWFRRRRRRVSRGATTSQVQR